MVNLSGDVELQVKKMDAIGADDYITKPFDNEDMLQKIKKYLGE